MSSSFSQFTQSVSNFFTSLGSANLQEKVPGRFSYIEHNMNWSESISQADSKNLECAEHSFLLTLKKIAKAIVLPFLLIAAFEGVVKNGAILLANAAICTANTFYNYWYPQEKVETKSEVIDSTAGSAEPVHPPESEASSSSLTSNTLTLSSTASDATVSATTSSPTSSPASSPHSPPPSNGDMSASIVVVDQPATPRRGQTPSQPSSRWWPFN